MKKSFIKKIASFLAMWMVLLIASCQKDTTTVTVDAGSWTLGANTYKVAYAVKTQTSNGQTMFIFSDVVLTGANPQANTVALTFATAPTASGTYQLVSAAGNTTGNQVQMSAGSQSSAYAYIGSPVNVDVTVSGGKVKLVIPQLSLIGTGGQASANFKATLQEQ